MIMIIISIFTRKTNVRLATNGMKYVLKVKLINELGKYEYRIITTATSRYFHFGISHETIPNRTTAEKQ